MISHRDPASFFNSLLLSLTSGSKLAGRWISLLASSVILLVLVVPEGSSMVRPRSSPRMNVLPRVTVGESAVQYPLRMNEPKKVVGDQASFIEPNPAPTIKTIKPNSGVQGQTLEVTITGSGFRAGVTQVDFSGGGITVNSVTAVTSTKLVASMSIKEDAPLGRRNVYVINPGPDGGIGGPLKNGFEVKKDVEPPLVEVLSPKGGEAVDAGKALTIVWRWKDTVGAKSEEVSFSADGENFVLIDRGSPADFQSYRSGEWTVQSFNWNVSEGFRGRFRIRVEVSDAAGNRGRAESGDFAIVGSDSLLYNWVPGDGHVHTKASWWDLSFWVGGSPVHTNGVKLTIGPTIEEQAQKAREEGLRWIIITDHEEMIKQDPGQSDEWRVSCEEIYESHTFVPLPEDLRKRWEDQKEQAEDVLRNYGVQVLIGEEVGCAHVNAPGQGLFCGDAPSSSHGHYLAYEISGYQSSLCDPSNASCLDYSTANMLSTSRLGFIAHPRSSFFRWDEWPEGVGSATGLEVINGGASTRVADYTYRGTPSRWNKLTPLADWDRLLLRRLAEVPHHVVGIGNSDAHWDGREGHENEHPGLAKTYVWIEGDLTPDAIYDALRQGRAIASNGPLLAFSINGRMIGETAVIKPGDQISLTLEWVDLDQLNVMREILIIWGQQGDAFTRGYEIPAQELENVSGSPTKRLSLLLREKVERRSFFRIIGQTTRGVVYTNPIWVDIK